jgi:hypothetical protein
LSDHFGIHLADIKIHDSRLKLRARCPACDNWRALEIGAGRIQRIVWHCHAGCSSGDVRESLARAGVHATCLAGGEGGEQDLVAELLHATSLATWQNRALTIMRVQALLEGFRSWPSGNELIELAARCGVSRAEAFRVSKTSPVIDPCTSSTYPRGHRSRRHAAPPRGRIMSTRLADPRLVSDSMFSGGEPHDRYSMTAPGTDGIAPMPQPFETLDLADVAIPAGVAATRPERPRNAGSGRFATGPATQGGPWRTAEGLSR